MEIIWTENAFKNYLNVIDYLFDNWSVNEILNFEKSVNQLVKNISSNIDLCPFSKILNYRKCVIDINNSLVYCVQNNKIIIVTLLDNRSFNIYYIKPNYKHYNFFVNLCQSSKTLTKICNYIFSV